MEILLIQPPLRDFYQTRQRIEPIGLAYLAASLRKKGFSAIILDCQAGHEKQIISLPDSLQYLKEFYIPGNLSPFKLFGHFYHFGMSFNEVENEIKKKHAKIFGISSMFSTYHSEALKVAEIVKTINKENIVVMGGAHVSSCPEEALKSPFVDFIVIGEGEESFSALVENIDNNDFLKLRETDGIGYKENGSIKINPKKKWIKNLDTLPYPSRELLNTEAYFIGRKRATKILTSRGCPFECSFCSVKNTMGNFLRQRTPENILEEMISCNARLGIESFDFEDDNFGYNKKAFNKLLDLIIECFGERKLRLYAMNGILPSVPDKIILQKMKKAGFENINLTFTSLDEGIRKNLSRPDTLKEFTNATALAVNAGLKVTGYIFIGVPGQKISGMIDDLIFLSKTPALIGPSIFYPATGSKLYNAHLQERLFLPDNFLSFRSTAFPIETDEFSRQDIFTIFYIARILNFIKSLNSSALKIIIESIPCKVKDFQITSEMKLKTEEIGFILLNYFLKNKIIFGAKLVNKSRSEFTYQIYKERCSAKVLSEFFSDKSCNYQPYS